MSDATPTKDLAGRARLAIVWTTGFQLFRDVIQFGLTLTLVRLLPAEAYGQFGFVTTLLSFLTLYSFREFLGHILQVRDGEPAHYQEHFTFGLVVQAAVFLVANVIAVGMRWFPAYAPASPLLHVMSVLFLLDLPCEFRVKMLERALDWRRLRLLHGLGLLAGGGLSVVTAFAGWGAYALLLPTLLVPLPFMYDLFVREGWRPDWSWNRDAFRPAWRFGLARVAAVSFVSAAVLLESSWLTGALGFAVLGLFGRAVSLANLLCGRLGGLLASSVYPVLTRIAPDTVSYRRASAMYLRAILWTVVPAGTFATLLSGPIVHVLYGQKWDAIVPMLPWTLAAGVILAVVQTAYTLLLAHGRQDRCLRADVWRLVGTVAMLTLLLRFGIQTYLAGMVAVHIVALVLVLRWLVQARAVAVDGLIDAVLPPLASTAVAGIALVAMRGAADAASGVVVDLIVAGSVFAGVYLICLRTVFASQLREIVAYLPKQQRISRLLLLQEAA